MSKLVICEKDYDKLYKLIKQNIYSCKIENIDIEDQTYHHNVKISQLPNILKYGILSKREQALLENRKLTEKEILDFSDDMHVNGLDQISLSSMDVDFDELYRDEMIYNPFNRIDVDIIISKDVKARRNTTNYFNEFLVDDNISVSLFKSIDVRLLKVFTHNFFDSIKNSKENRIKVMLEYYEYLKESALLLKNLDLNIPLREASGEIINLDINKVIDLPRIKVK